MALYHKYRPQKFADVIGQDHIVRTLSNQITSSTLAHAYLLSGSRGLGKTTISRLIAKAINCTNRAEGSAEPCNACSMCEAIGNGRSIDVIEIDAASNTGVDNVRENIIENVQFQPTQAKYKVFIIDEVHMLSTSSFNALLKTLEEPPSYVVFILATTELQKIPETILSRCQRYVFSRVPKNTLSALLDKVASEEKITIDEDVKEAIIAKAEGGVRDTISMLDQIMSTGEKHLTREQASIFLPISPLSDTLVFLENLIDHKGAEAMQFIHTLSAEGRDMPTFLETLLETLRVVMIAKIQGNAAVGADLTSEALESVEKISKQISSAELLRLIDISMKRRMNIKNSSIPELPIELIILEWIQNNDKIVVAAPSAPATPIAAKVVETVKVETPEIKAAPEANLEAKTTVVEAPVVETSPVPTVETVAEIPAVTTTASSVNSPNFQTLKNKWGEVIKSVEKKSASLVSLLKSSNLLSLENNMVTLEVSYKIHQDKFNQKEYKKIMEDALLEVMGAPLAFRTEVAAKNTTEANAGDLENLAAAFGGVVV
jgi:DNA polymerase-3 subunit gamma/tau